MTVVGPSGSGKSSVVRAGLVPALREGAVEGSENWFFASVMPGSSPFAELEAALAVYNAEQAPSMWPGAGSFAINIDKDLSIPDAPDDEYIYWSN